MSAADKIAEPLLPCPFCGGERLRKERGLSVVYIACQDCNTYGPNEGSAAWNRRADLADAQAQENARLRAENERLNKMLQPEWFYAADGYESEACRGSVWEVLDEDYFWDRPKTGQHVVEINVATALPSIWAAVRFNCTCPDPEDCECDNDMIVTEHSSEAEARAALGDAT